MNAAVDVVSMSPGLASWVTSCLACHSSAWITLVQSGSLLVLHVLVLMASQCVSLCIRVLFSRSASAPKESMCKLFPGYMPFFFFFIYVTLLPGYPAFCVSQLAGKGKDLHGVNPTDEHAASQALCRLPIPNQIANGVCTIEQVKLAASLWFSEDETDAGFCFTYQPGLVSSQKGSGEMQGRTSGRSRI